MNLIKFILITACLFIFSNANADVITRGIVNYVDGSVVHVYGDNVCSMPDGYWDGYNITITTYIQEDGTVNYEYATVLNYLSYDCSFEISVPTRFARYGSRVKLY